jgi:hypothetical protein
MATSPLIRGPKIWDVKKYLGHTLFKKEVSKYEMLKEFLDILDFFVVSPNLNLGVGPMGYS